MILNNFLSFEYILSNVRPLNNLNILNYMDFLKTFVSMSAQQILIRLLRMRKRMWI